VISSSPLLEHDAMYMKLLYERALTRRWAKQHAPPAPKLAKKPVPVVPERGKAAGRPPAKAARPAAPKPARRAVSPPTRSKEARRRDSRRR